jgi:hypothetical protein
MPYSNPAKRLEYAREWYAARRAKGIESLGGKCVQCGTTEDLEIDHIDPATKVSHRIFSWSWARIEIELKKCQLLCMPHHLDKTIAYISTAGGTWKSRPCHKSKSGCHCSYHRNLRETEVSVMLQNRYKNSPQQIESRDAESKLPPQIESRADIERELWVS